MITEGVITVLEENLWFLATCGDEPHVVPVGFKCITEEGKLAVGALLLKKTLENIEKNSKISVAAANPVTAESYQIKGKAEIITKGKLVNYYRKLAEDTWHGVMPLKCIVLITPEHVIVTSPNEHNKEEILITN